MLDSCLILLMLIMWLVLLAAFLIILSPRRCRPYKMNAVQYTYHQILMDEGTLSQVLLKL